MYDVMSSCYMLITRFWGVPLVNRPNASLLRLYLIYILTKVGTRFWLDFFFIIRPIDCTPEDKMEIFFKIGTRYLERICDGDGRDRRK